MGSSPSLSGVINKQKRIGWAVEGDKLDSYLGKKLLTWVQIPHSLIDNYLIYYMLQIISINNKRVDWAVEGDKLETYLINLITWARIPYSLNCID